MNNSRRKEIQEIVNQYDNLLAELQEINERLKEVSEAEEEAYNNLPEGLQESERGEAMSEIVDNLSTCQSDAEDIETSIESLIESLNGVEE